MNTSDASKILKVNQNTIGNLIHRGILTDISGKTGRHQFKVAAKEVRALAKVYKKHLGIETLKLGMNGHLTEVKPVKVKPIDTGIQVAQAIPNGIFSRLERIESKLDMIAGGLNQLTKVWE